MSSSVTFSGACLSRCLPVASRPTLSLRSRPHEVSELEIGVHTQRIRKVAHGGWGGGLLVQVRGIAYI